MSHPLAPLARRLAETDVRFVIIGVSGANLYGPSGQAVFSTEDIDLFLPLDPDNLVRTWAACEATGLTLTAGVEPLEQPRDATLATRVIERRALTRATGPDGLSVDLTLVMDGFDFEQVWSERRTFIVGGSELPTARLRSIVESKFLTGRDKDKLFLATHKDALEQLLKRTGR